MLLHKMNLGSFFFLYFLSLYKTTVSFSLNVWKNLPMNPLEIRVSFVGRLLTINWFSILAMSIQTFYMFIIEF